ncbi:MAG: LCP family protein [Oscillospiraceae bacterium]|nr:LCP family protein [Oscillospiraceae bacterium]
MSYKKGAVAIPFLITFLVSLVLFGATAWYMYRITVDDDEPAAASTSEVTVGITEEMNHAILFAYENGTNDTDLAFAVVYCMPYKEATLSIPISPKTVCTTDSGTQTVAQIYRVSGAGAVANAVSGELGVEVSRYMKLDAYGLEKLHSIMGGVTVSVPSEYTELSTGMKSVNSEQLSDLMTYPFYSGGEDFRTKFIGMAVQNMINTGFGESLSARLKTSYETMSAVCETNITATDYANYQEAAEHLVAKGQAGCILVVPSGSWSGETYTIDASFRDVLKEQWIDG